jgi:hypothetical protein
MQMTQAKLRPLETWHLRAQRVAILEAPGRLSIGRAEILEPGDGEVRVKIK